MEEHQEGNVGTYRKEMGAGKEKMNIQEGKGGTYRKEMEERTVRKRRNIQEGNGGTYRNVRI